MVNVTYSTCLNIIYYTNTLSSTKLCFLNFFIPFVQPVPDEVELLHIMHMAHP